MSAYTLEIEHVSKRYGRREALRDVGLTAGPGEIIALLGRNGAGKSTLMNIVTGYLAMTQGRVAVCGHDVQDAPMEARRHVGYLPEQPPLHADMTVREYLRYAARLKAVPNPREEVERVIRAASLEEYAGRLSGRLSKGYRQRLGMAQALLGSPALLVLDEPGNGLDPVQAAHMRELIGGAGQGSAVLLSSHLLSEVSGVCTRAVVLDGGAIRYDGPMERLTRSACTLRARWRDGEGIEEALSALPGVAQARFERDREPGCVDAVLHHAEGCDLRADVAGAVVVAGGRLLELTPERVRLEDAFLRLLGEDER